MLLTPSSVSAAVTTWSDLHCFVFCISCGLNLKEGPSSDIGVNVREASLRSGTEVAEYGGASEFQEGYADALASKDMVLVNPEVSKVILEANRLSASLSEEDPLCDRKWTAKCPEGWTLLGEDQCSAVPGHYSGACKTLQSFVGKSIKEKQQSGQRIVIDPDQATGNRSRLEKMAWLLG